MEILTLFSTADAWIALLTLTALEIVLGIDNIIFIAILVGKLPAESQDKARRLGISLALIIRLGLLFSIAWIMRLTQPVFSVLDHGFSGRDLILIGGGLFLIGKSTFEMHEKLEAPVEQVHGQPGAGPAKARSTARFGSTLIQILLLDIVFSLDSVITAVGMAQHIPVMVIAMVVAVGVMLLSASQVSKFVHRHPTIKILALSFLLLIGVMLLMEGMGSHVNKAYIYFAMAFSLVVELLNMRYRKVNSPVVLHEAKAVALENQ